MGRHALRRGGLTAAVCSLAVAVAAATVTVLSGSGDTADAAPADATGTTEITLTDPSSDTARAERPLAAGSTGFLHRESGITGLLWTDYTTGATVSVNDKNGLYTPFSPCANFGSTCRNAFFGSDGDLVVLPSGADSKVATFWKPSTHTASTFSSSYPYRALAGETVVTSRTLIDRVDGVLKARTISPDWLTVNESDIAAADSAGVLLDADTYLYYLDTATAEATQAFSGVAANSYPVQSEDRIGWLDTAADDLHLKSRTDLTAEEQVVDLPDIGELDNAPVLIGDWLLLPLATNTDDSTLMAVSLVDGSTRTLLDAADEYLLHASGDTALVAGGTSATDWWTQRVSLADDGTPTLTKVYQVPATENAKTGLALSRGSLRVAEDSTSSTSDTTSVRTLTTDGGTTLSASAATESSSVDPECPYADTACAAMWGNSVRSPRDVYLRTYYDGDEGGSGLENADELAAVGYNALQFHTEGGSIVDVSDNYAVYNSGGTTPMQYVGEFGQGQKLKRSVRAAALHGPTLWSATSTAGQVTSYSLTADKTLSTVTVPDAGCVPTELQAAGRWLYWSCGTDSAGVYDTKAGTSVAVTPGDVLLGDGFTVRHDHPTDQLILTEAATGTTRVIASDVPDTGLAADRRYRWAVDEYTGLVAWFDLHERTHIATTGVTPSAVTAFETKADSFVEPPSSTPWGAGWLLSRPVTSWSLTLTSLQSGTTGKATRTITGGEASAWVSTTWNGRTASGGYFPNGEFSWVLKATGLGTSTPVTVTTGTAYLLRGAAVRHDFTSPDGPDGRGDLLTLSSSGGLTFHAGTGTGKFGDKSTGTGWATSVKAIPFGDLSGDRCNDVLVRLSSGALRLYKPGCGKAVKPSTSYTTIASSGWTEYDVLTSPGDISGDGRADLVARNSSTGTVYLYKGTSTGKLSARVKLYDNWKTYKKVVGAGDLNGDGIGDLLAQDKSNNLYRYYGTGKGTFGARVKLFSDWGASYNAVVGVGDITEDGKADLVSRDTSGNLYRNSGDGKGSFGGRTKIATGWGGYKSLS